jgi:hypothetical protein
MLCGHGTAGDHGWAESNPNDAEWEGWHVRPWQDPAAVAVKHRGEWFFLTEDGNLEREREGELAAEGGGLPGGDGSALPASESTG